MPRRLHIETVHGKAAVCIGVRRSGKSTYMFQVIEILLSSGVPQQNILYLNFFDDRLHNLREDNLGLIAEAYYSIYPEKKNTETVYCFFDEIQAVSGWEPFVDLKPTRNTFGPYCFGTWSSATTFPIRRRCPIWHTGW